MSIEGRVALVTGASRGIGRACAVALAEQGAKVAVGYRQDKEGALETAGRCPGSRVVAIDVRSADAVDLAFGEIEEALGPAEILVNNAGVTDDHLLIRMSDEMWDEVIDTNLNGVYRCTKRAMRSMLRSKWGRIVVIGSLVGLEGNAGQSNYAAAKAGVVGFTKSIAREVAGHGITANVVAPGLIDTALTADLTDAQRSRLIERVPVGRAGTPEEVARAVIFCVDAAYMTGQTIVLDGGLK